MLKITVYVKITVNPLCFKSAALGKQVPTPFLCQQVEVKNNLSVTSIKHRVYAMFLNKLILTYKFILLS